MFSICPSMMEGLNLVPDLIRRAIMQMSDGITDYIAIQKSPNQIEIQIKPDNLEDLSMTGFNVLWQSKNIQPPNLTLNPIHMYHRQQN